MIACSKNLTKNNVHEVLRKVTKFQEEICLQTLPKTYRGEGIPHSIILQFLKVQCPGTDILLVASFTC